MCRKTSDSYVILYLYSWKNWTMKLWLNQPKCILETNTLLSYCASFSLRALQSQNCLQKDVTLTFQCPRNKNASRIIVRPSELTLKETGGLGAHGLINLSAPCYFRAVAFFRRRIIFYVLIAMVSQRRRLVYIQLSFVNCSHGNDWASPKLRKL